MGFKAPKTKRPYKNQIVRTGSKLQMPCKEGVRNR